MQNPQPRKKSKKTELPETDRALNVATVAVLILFGLLAVAIIALTDF